MDQEFLNSLRSNLRSSTAITPPSQDFSYLGGFARSGLATLPELIGIGAPPAVEAWRRENPLGSFGSQMLSAAVPYAGWYGVAGKLPGLGRAINALSTAERVAASPVRTAVARELVRFAPLEAGRIGAAAAVGDPGSVGDIATEAGINLTAGSALVGLGALWRASRVTGEAKINADLLQKIYPDFDPSAARQLQLRQLHKAALARQESLGAGADSDGILAQLRAQLARMELEIRQEIPERGQGGAKFRYIDGLEGDGDAQAINRMFYTMAGRGADRMRFTASYRPFDFDDTKGWQEAAGKFGLPSDWLSYVQYPRFVRFKNGNQATADLALTKKNLTSVGDGWYIGREPEGLYVMAKRLKGSKAKNDQWLWFKTDTPSTFTPRQTKWADLMLDRSRWEAGHIPANDLKMAKELNVYGALENMLESLPFENARAIPQGSVQRVAQNLFEKMGGSGDVAKTTSTTYNRMMRLAREFVAPSQFQFSKNPLARYLLGIARYTYDHAQATAEKLMYGIQAKGGDGSLFKEIWGVPKETGSIKAALDKVDSEELVGIWRSWARQLSPEAARKELGLSENAYRFLKKLEDVDRWQVDQIIKTQRVTGASDFRPMANHLMISRTWDGDWRLPLYDEGGNMVYMASGKTANAASLHAKQAIERAKQLGTKLVQKDEFPIIADRRNDFQLAGRLKVNSPTFRLLARDRTNVPQATSPRTFQERTGVGGYIGENAPWTKAELEQILRDHIYNYQKYLAEASVNHRLAGDMLKLAKQDAHIYRQLADRLRDLAGKPGPLARYQNELVDRVLAPALGKNSASKIVGALNTSIYNLQLGFGNMAFPVLNAMTFLQTVMPHMAFVLGGTPEKVARYYTWFPAAGASGKPRAGVGSLDMMKLLGRSLQEMRKPDAELLKNFQRAGTEGVWDPRFVEEYVGQGAKTAVNLKSVINGEQGVLGWLKSLSEFLPAQSEKFARGHAMTLGHIIGRDMLSLKDEKLYHFAREFVHNTMYLYSTADRARLITGPVGSLFGMFKNWQMHYLAQMMLYTDEAVMRNNWKPLLWMAGGTGAMAGAGGMPMYAAADLMSRWMTDESLMLNIYQMFGGEDDTRLADSVYYGLPGFLGVSLQGSAAAPGADPARDASLLFTFAQLDRMKYLGKALGTAIDSWAATGEHPGQDANVRDLLVRALGPKTLYRLMQVIGDGDLRSLSTGYPVMNNIDMRQRALFALGLNPTEIDRTYAVADELWRDQEKMKLMVQTYGSAWAEAQLEGDGEAMEKIIRNAVAQGVDISSVIRSAHARLRKSREPQLDRQFEIRKVAPFVESGMVGN